MLNCPAFPASGWSSFFLPRFLFFCNFLNVNGPQDFILSPCLTSLWSPFLGEYTCCHNSNVHLMISTFRSSVLIFLLSSSSTYSFVYSPVPPSCSIDSSNLTCLSWSHYSFPKFLYPHYSPEACSSLCIRLGFLRAKFNQKPDSSFSFSSFVTKFHSAFQISHICALLVILCLTYWIVSQQRFYFPLNLFKSTLSIATWVIFLKYKFHCVIPLFKTIQRLLIAYG